MLRQKCDAWREEVEKLAPQRDQVGRLHAHNDTANKRMQAQLSEATNPDQLQTIRTRMERYRQERDTASKQVEELQEQLEMHKAELYQATEVSESRANQVQEQLAQYQQDASTLASKAQDYELRMRRYREERNQAQSANKALQEQIKTLQTTVQDLTSQLQSQHQVAASLTNMESGVFETGDYSPQQPMYNRETSSDRKPKSRSCSSGSYQLTNVRTKDGQMATYIQKPPMPLNATKHEPSLTLRVAVNKS